MSLSRCASPALEAESNDLLSILVDELKCDICLKTFCEPKTLACLHTFCRICVDRLMKVAANTHDLSKLHRRHFFSCPVCRKRHAIPCNGVDGLPTHFKLANLCAIIKKSQEATMSEGPFCTTHKEDPLQSFCSTCMSCLCIKCHGDHIGHDINNDVNKAAQFHRERLSSKISKAASVVRHVESHVGEIDAFLNKEADLIAAVKTARNKLVSAIDSQERDQLQQIRSLFTNRSGKRLAEYRVEMLRFKRVLQEACSEADMVHGLDEMDFLMSVKKTMSTLEPEGFDSSDLPAFYSHDIYFDRPNLPENVLGAISYKRIDRSPPSTSSAAAASSSSSQGPSNQHHYSSRGNRDRDSISSDEAPSPTSSNAPNTPPSLLQVMPSMMPRPAKWFSKVIHDHRSSEQCSAVRGLTHDGRIISYQWLFCRNLNGTIGISSLTIKSPAHEGFQRSRSVVARFPDVTDLDTRITAMNNNGNMRENGGSGLWLADRTHELTTLWEIVMMRHTNVRNVEPGRHFKLIVNDFRAAAGGTWMRGLTHDGYIVSYKYDGHSEECISVMNEEDPQYLEIVAAAYRMPDRSHLPLFREQINVLYKIWELNLRMRSYPSSQFSYHSSE